MISAIILAALLPAIEAHVVRDVAEAYGLNREQAALMVSIRRAENGVPPYQFGVADKRCRGLLEQARWTANTIRKRYTGNLDAFGRRWCPYNTAVWLKNVRWFMRRQGFNI